MPGACGRFSGGRQQVIGSNDSRRLGRAKRSPTPKHEIVGLRFALPNLRLLCRVLNCCGVACTSALHKAPSLTSKQEDLLIEYGDVLKKRSLKIRIYIKLWLGANERLHFLGCATRIKKCFDWYFALGSFEGETVYRLGQFYEPRTRFCRMTDRPP